jgi:hypothetical protein
MVRMAAELGKHRWRGPVGRGMTLLSPRMPWTPRQLLPHHRTPRSIQNPCPKSTSYNQPYPRIVSRSARGTSAPLCPRLAADEQPSPCGPSRGAMRAQHHTAPVIANTASASGELRTFRQALLGLSRRRGQPPAQTTIHATRPCDIVGDARRPKSEAKDVTDKTKTRRSPARRRPSHQLRLGPAGLRPAGGWYGGRSPGWASLLWSPGPSTRRRSSRGSLTGWSATAASKCRSSPSPTLSRWA